MVYRKKIQIFHDLLNAAKEGNAGKFELYQRARTSHDYFKNLLKTAIERGYVSVNERKYNLTDRGMEFCESGEGYLSLKQKAEALTSKADNMKRRILKRNDLENL